MNCRRVLPQSMNLSGGCREEGRPEAEEEEPEVDPVVVERPSLPGRGILAADLDKANITEPGSACRSATPQTGRLLPGNSAQRPAVRPFTRSTGGSKAQGGKRVPASSGWVDSLQRVINSLLYCFVWPTMEEKSFTILQDCFPVVGRGSWSPGP